MTERIDIDRLAREHNFERAAYSYHATPNELAAYTRAVMEECAKACHFYDENGEGPDCWDWHSKDYAAAIREMMP